MICIGIRSSSSALVLLLAAGLVLAVAASPLARSRAEASEHGSAGPTAQETFPQTVPDEGYDPAANLPYLFAVFIVTWAGLFGYAFMMTQRRREMQRDLEALRLAMAERERQQAEGAPDE